MKLRDLLNQANPNETLSALQQLGFGDLLNLLLAGSETEGSAIGGAVGAPAAVTSSQNVTTAATDLPTAEALANALQTSYNAAQVDIVALRAEVLALTTLVNQLRTAALSVARTTETGVTVTANVATLAAKPSFLFNAKGTAGGTPGAMLVLVGAITGPQAITPIPGQCVWDGNLKVLFSAGDAITLADFTYATAADATASALQKELGQRP